MKTIVVLLVAALFLTACSTNPTEGCWITHANGVKLNPQVQMLGNGEALAMVPGRSYQISCVRKIDNSSIGDIISEDQRTLRITALPLDAELRIYPNERDKIYRGMPVPSSENVWNALQDASKGSFTYWFGWAVALALLIIIIMIGTAYNRRQRNKREDVPSATLQF